MASTFRCCPVKAPRLMPMSVHHTKRMRAAWSAQDSEWLNARKTTFTPTIAVMSPKQIARIHSSMWLYHGDFVFVFIWSDSILPPPKRPVLFTAAGAAYGMWCRSVEMLKC